MDRPPIGEQELEIFKFVADSGPVPARDVVEYFGKDDRWHRSTVLTVLERLRAKGYLTRKRSGAVYLYSAKVAMPEVLQSLVGQFVERTLGGSVSSFTAYLAQTKKISDDEYADLMKAVQALKSKKKRR
jgi:predicted transcriptional regulator